MATPPPSPALPAQLALANRWAQSLGMTTRTITGTGPSGETLSGLEIHRANVVLVAFSPPGADAFIILKMTVNVPAALRATVGRMGEDTRRQLTEDIYSALQSNSRSGYQVVPPNTVDFSQMEQISLEQVMRLDENDATSFNRFADGIQELVSGYSRVGRRIATYVSLPQGEGTSRLRSDPAQDMFR